MSQDPYQQLVAWWNSVRHSNEWKSYIPDPRGGNLTYPVEQAITKILGVQPALDYAQVRPSQLGYPDSLGEEKALRHILLAAELHRTAPRLADPLLYGHEYLTNTLTGQPLDVRYKDLQNNSIGKYIGQRTTNRADAEAWAQAAMPAADTRDYSQLYPPGGP